MEQRIEDTECAIQILYEGEPRCICCRNWVETAPAHLRPVPEADSEGIINRTALVVRMSKNHNDDAVVRPLTLHSIVVQSRALQQTLTEVFAGYQGITTAAMQQQQHQPKLVFRAPLHAFIYRWDAFTAILERQRHDDPVAAGFAHLLYEILDSAPRCTASWPSTSLPTRCCGRSSTPVTRDNEYEETFCRVDSPDYYGPKEQAYFQIAARSVD
ncbi:uncharacterized protein BO72DRAFT_484257 [Aspergillus fijiensis CBS 313.89]|uniref:Uncharacterized protein n=1 Tax=Aspergillus fijiensis CBS 313.89 TaxID=1448319 RepID=A0A8G1W223_9EURO|nr:uncharacterized protein BO72DRAFT_484257 [Aspergillus fijiensis CBS 313.89]RAK80011.1 hypothetical protein BO72DRAFT_484257 [Aspergillus fijiensis CBS 313.89]